MQPLYQVLDSLHLPNGAYLASSSQDYAYVWLRDMCYAILPFLDSSCGRYVQACHALLAMFRSYEWKIDIHNQRKPELDFEYIHARYTSDLRETAIPWGHAQNDAIGLFLWCVGRGNSLGKAVVRDAVDLRLLQKLVGYLDRLEYWHAPDNGMWEEGMEVHASSVGACVAGLEAVRSLVNIPQGMLERGRDSLTQLLPHESNSKTVDLALLSLIYPYGVVSKTMATDILANVRSALERSYGCIRYVGDRYYNEGSEAEWCFGFPWLGLCYWSVGDYPMAYDYWRKTERIIPLDGNIPELYIGGKGVPNGNAPLAWAVALTILLWQRLAMR
ncbi:MAG: glycoside hydrolase family 15 protein [Peptococcaceae bacterium]|nr:glycoside hydrolase family 15 protein [Peptococcaceae bacterium]